MKCDFYDSSADHYDQNQTNSKGRLSCEFTV